MASVAEHGDPKSWSMKRVVVASSAGTAFEWYDFFIFGAMGALSRAQLEFVLAWYELRQRWTRISRYRRATR